VVLFVGRLSPEKGVVEAIEAWTRSSLSRQTKLRVIGDGPLRSELQNEWDGRVEFAGWLEPDVVRAGISAARCVLAPSRWLEPFGLVVGEAMGCGTPVLVFDIGGPAELLADVGDLIVSVDDVVALAAELDVLVGDRADQLGRAVRTAFEETLSSERGAASLVHAYERAIG
jgi:glycosyltransferase involved in cell wall biosynthesis